MKKLLFVTNQFKTGGVENVFINFSRLIKTEIYLLPVHQCMEEGLIQSLPKNVTVIKHPYKMTGLITSVLGLLGIKKIVKSLLGTEDILAINFSDTITTLFLSVFLKSNERISWCHCNPNAYKESKFFMLYGKIFKKFDKIICICNSQKKEFCKVFGNIYENKIELCYNLTDLNAIDTLKREALNFEQQFILMVARFDNRSKDFYTLIDAYNNLSIKLKQRYSLVLVGNGEDFDNVKQYADHSKEKGSIHFVGMQSNPYKWMSRASLFVLSSKSEGFPLVLCEALSCSCPVISSDCISGPRDILENSKYGELFTVGDSSMLTEKITLVLTDEVKYKNFKNNARKRVEEINRLAVNSLYKIVGYEDNK